MAPNTGETGAIDAQMGQGVQVEPDWDLAAQPAPDYEIDQRFKLRDSTQVDGCSTVPMLALMRLKCLSVLEAIYDHARAAQRGR